MISTLRTAGERMLGVSILYGDHPPECNGAEWSTSAKDMLGGGYCSTDATVE